MIGPKRLIEEGSAFDRALLRAAREDRPSSDYARRVIAAVAVMPAAPAALATQTTLLGRLLRLRYVAPVVLGAGACALAVTSMPREREPVPSAPVSMAIAAPAAAPTEARMEPNVPVTTPDALPNAPAPSASAIPRERRPTAPVATAPAATAEPTPAPVTGASLQREVELLDAVKRSLRAGQSADAERALAAYDAEFPSGSLKPEAGFLHVRVLLAKGDRARAVALGEELLARNPNSVHANRIRAALAADAAEAGGKK